MVTPGQVEVARVLGPERRVSRMEREDALVQRAMRKRSRKVRREGGEESPGFQVSKEGDFLVFVEKKGLLTTQNGTQQVRTGGENLLCKLSS